MDLRGDIGVKGAPCHTDARAQGFDRREMNTLLYAMDEDEDRCCELPRAQHPF